MNIIHKDKLPNFLINSELYQDLLIEKKDTICIPTDFTMDKLNFYSLDDTLHFMSICRYFKVYSLPSSIYEKFYTVLCYPERRKSIDCYVKIFRTFDESKVVKQLIYMFNNESDGEIYDCCEHGYTDLLTFYIDIIGREFDLRKCLLFCARYNRQECLAYLLQNFIDDSNDDLKKYSHAATVAASRNNFVCLEALVTHGIPLESRIGYITVTCSSFECLQFLVEKTAVTFTKHYNASNIFDLGEAVFNGSMKELNKCFQCMNYMYENGYFLSPDSFKIAAEYGNLELFQYIYEKRVKYHNNLEYQCDSSDDEEEDVPEPYDVWPDGIDILMAQNGNLECLIFSYDEGCPVSLGIIHSCLHNYRLINSSEQFAEKILKCIMYCVEEKDEKFTELSFNHLIFIKNVIFIHYYSSNYKGKLLYNHEFYVEKIIERDNVNALIFMIKEMELIIDYKTICNFTETDDCFNYLFNEIIDHDQIDLFIIQFLAQHNKLDHLKMIMGSEQIFKNISSDVKRDVIATRMAAKYGNLECLKFLRENGFGWDSSIFKFAKLGGYDDIYKYAMKNSCPKWWCAPLLY